MFFFRGQSLTNRGSWSVDYIAVFQTRKENLSGLEFPIFVLIKTVVVNTTKFRVQWMVKTAPIAALGLGVELLGEDENDIMKVLAVFEPLLKRWKLLFMRPLTKLISSRQVIIWNLFNSSPDGREVLLWAACFSCINYVPKWGRGYYRWWWCVTHHIQAWLSPCQFPLITYKTAVNHL